MDTANDAAISDSSTDAALADVKITRREFVRLSASSGAAFAGAMVGFDSEPSRAAVKADSARPNFLWIVAEDLSPLLGCYGDSYARTPHIDRLAKDSVLYERAFAPCPVCAPARSSLATGIYACSLGSHQMRSRIELPPEVRVWSALLRDAGYYCTNNAKTDYNFAVPADAWDQNNNRAHWRNRPANTPFFSMFSPNVTHESQIRGDAGKFARLRESLPPEQRHDPAQAPLPPYYPDAPEVREDVARYYDNVSRLDSEVGDLLQQLEADGLADNTIVFFFTDHGTGMPRSKRSPHDSGLRVPLLIRFGKKWAHLAPAATGRRLDRLVNFVDFGPTVLSLAGIPVPAFMQGKPFLGPRDGRPQPYTFGFRDRMDERYDCARTVRDARFRYIRNFMPHLPAGQHNAYMFQTPTTRVWHGLYEQGKLNRVQANFWQASRPIEELYDTQSDPHELKNLATNPAYRAVLQRMKAALHTWMLDIQDLGLLPEPELYTRFGGSPYAAVRAKPESYPLHRILETVSFVQTSPVKPDTLLRRLNDADSAVRYQAVLGLLCVGSAVKAELALALLLNDSSPSVQIAAAEWLGRYGNKVEAALQVLMRHLQSDQQYVALQAANALDHLGERARPAASAMKVALVNGSALVQRVLEASPHLSHLKEGATGAATE